jgi:threonine/homoserine/homoserine lactone efflux protein
VQLLILGTVVILLFSSADLLCVFLAERLMQMFKNSPGTRKVAGRVGGSILVALGLNLALSL